MHQSFWNNCNPKICIVWEASEAVELSLWWSFFTFPALEKKIPRFLEWRRSAVVWPIDAVFKVFNQQWSVAQTNKLNKVVDWETQMLYAELK